MGLALLVLALSANPIEQEFLKAWRDGISAKEINSYKGKSITLTYAIANVDVATPSVLRLEIDPSYRPFLRDRLLATLSRDDAAKLSPGDKVILEGRLGVEIRMCPHCRGTGYHLCGTCGGAGQMKLKHNIYDKYGSVSSSYYTWPICDSCRGKGVSTSQCSNHASFNPVWDLFSLTKLSNANEPDRAFACFADNSMRKSTEQDSRHAPKNNGGRRVYLTLEHFRAKIQLEDEQTIDLRK